MEAKIRENVERVRSLGFSIVTRRFGVQRRGYWTASDQWEKKCCCPLGAVLICAKTTRSSFPCPAVKEALGVDDGWIGGFLLAFDGTTREEQDQLEGDVNSGFALGVQLRQEFLREKYISE